MKELYFHEDDYCQVELLPVSALVTTVDEINKIAAFSNLHWDGTGWTPLYHREDPSQYLKSLSIPIDSVAAALDSILGPVAEVYTGYSTHRERCKNTRAWATSCGTALLADFDGTGIIEHLWIVNEPPKAEDIDQFQQALRTLAEFGDFFIADWKLDISLPCRDVDKLRQYLSGAAVD